MNIILAMLMLMVVTIVTVVCSVWVEASRPASSSPKLIPTPRFMPPGYPLFSSVFRCFLSPRESPEVGGEDNFLDS